MIPIPKLIKRENFYPPQSGDVGNYILVSSGEIAFAYAVGESVLLWFAHESERNAILALFERIEELEKQVKDLKTRELGPGGYVEVERMAPFGMPGMPEKAGVDPEKFLETLVAAVERVAKAVR